MARHLDLGARVRRSFLAISLVAGTMAAVAVAPQTATAAATDQLVVVDVNDAATGDFSSSSLKTVNADGTKSFASPVELPSADAGAANAFALAGSSNGNGALARSADGNYLAVAGYHHIPGPTGEVKAGVPVKPKDTKTAASAEGPGVQRMVARVGNTGTVDTSTLLGTAGLSGSHPRGVATDTGSSFYLSGNGGSTDTGVFSIPLGGGTKTPIAGGVSGEATTTDQRNTRSVHIAGGGLYTISEKATLQGLGKIGTGLPSGKSALTRLGPKAAVVDFPVPTAVAMVDASSSVDGIDTGYVSVDIDDNGTNDEVRKYTSDGTTWTLNGTKAGDYPFLTARVSGGTVQLFASKGSIAPANTIVKFDDTGGAGAGNFGSDTTVATAAEGHAFRGLAFAPTGWNPGTISSSAPTASVAHGKVGGTIGDAHNPGTTLTLADDDTDAADLTVTAESSDTNVIPNSGIEVTGTGLDRAVSFTPAGVGRATITFTVTDDNSNTGTAQVSYAASSAPTSSSGRYLYESSDLSSAVDVGDGHAIAVSSEDNVVRLYKKDESGRPVKTFEFTDATTGIGSTNADLESMARVNDTLYVLGSHGNNSSGEAKPARRVLFTVAITGTGADTELTYIGRYNGLWDALRTWDEAHSNRLGFAAGQASGVAANDPNGFNIEGIEFAPGSTSTAYLAFRAPKVTHDGQPSAVIVPVENANALVLGGAEPQFGDPIYLDLGGRTIREIRKNSDDDYLISASKFDAGSPDWALFAWNGNPDSTPVSVKDLPNPDPIRTGSWESIVSVPHPLTAGGSVSLISDSGDTTYYGDATTGASESKGFRKSYIDEFTTSSFTEYPTPPAFSPPSDLSSPSQTESSVSLAWTKVADATGYILSQRIGAGTPTTKQVGDVSSTSFSDLTANTEYTFDITAVKADGTESEASSPLKVTTSALPTDRPSNVRWTSRTSTSLKIAWTKKSGSAKYKVRYTPEGAATYKYLTVGNVSSATISGLLRGKSYGIKVAAIASNGTQSPYSSALIASTSNLRPPTNLAKVTRTSTTITLSWTKATGANGYRIGKGIGSGTRSSIEVSGGDTETVKLTGLTPGKTYTIDIASLEGSGNSRSSYSPRISVTTSG